MFSVPTLVIFKAGRPIDSRVGFASRGNLEAWIKSNL
ncbi:MAG: thioredoxin family protein [Candidatus Micrarchaeia archaeon]